MKKILSLFLAISFVLCGAAALSVNAGNVIINDWTISRGGGSFVKNNAYEFEWKTDANGKTWDWPAMHAGSLTEGSISATVSPAGGIGIYFGAQGMANAADGGAAVSNAENLKYSLVAFEYSSGIPKLRFYYDNQSAGGATISKESDMPLDDAKYGIDGTSDVTIKVEFTAAGKVEAYVNGEKVITRASGFPTAGAEYGMMVKSANYGTGKASTKVGYVKSFSTTSDISTASKWTVRRGGNSWQIAPSDNTEFVWKYVADAGNANNGRSYTNLIQYYKNLEEGSVTISVAKNSRVGIAFAGSGFENVKEGSGNVAVSTAPNFKYYWAVVDWDSSAQSYYLALKTDASDADGTQTVVQKVALTQDIATTNYTIKVNFTKTGNISVYFNEDKLIDVSGQTIYGSQLGVINAGRGPLADKVGQVAGTVTSFNVVDPAAATGDFTSIYVIVSAMILCAAFTVVCISRKKKIAE
ncbi:MAG: hypothetical protein E7626_04240 [Ruminococcaceae bacterium]|nr:hypothetical protein [Oscillospiraceae bacterium]